MLPFWCRLWVSDNALSVQMLYKINRNVVRSQIFNWRQSLVWQLIVAQVKQLMPHFHGIKLKLFKSLPKINKPFMIRTQKRLLCSQFNSFYIHLISLRGRRRRIRASFALINLIQFPTISLGLKLNILMLLISLVVIHLMMFCCKFDRMGIN